MAYNAPLEGKRINIKADGNSAIDNDTVTLASGTNITLNQSGSTITVATNLASGTVANSQLANMAANTIKGNNTASPAAPADLTVAQTKTLLALNNVDNTADASKTFAASQITSGTLAIARVPTGTTGTTVSLGNHTHSDVPTTRTISTTAPLSGGGDLSANRTLSISSGGISNTLLATMAANTIKGNNTGSTAAPSDLTVAQLMTMIRSSLVFCQVYRNVAQSIPNTTYTDILWDAESSDASGMHSTSSNTNRVTVPSAGRYHIRATLSWGSTGGDRFMFLTKNGTALLGTGTFMVTGVGTPRLTTETVQDLAANDYITLQVWQNSGGSVNTDVYDPSFPQYASALTVAQIM